MLAANRTKGDLLTRFYLMGRDIGMEKRAMEKEEQEPKTCGACGKPFKKGEAFYPITTPGNRTIYVHEHCLRKGAPRVAGKGDAPMVK